MAHARFKVLMPRATRKDAIEVGDRAKFYSLSIREDGILYEASCKVFSSEDPKVMRDALDEEHKSLKSPEFSIRKERVISVCGYSGLEYEVAYKSGTMNVRRVFAVDNRLYRLDVSYTARQQKTPDNMAAFFNSFTLLTDEG